MYTTLQYDKCKYVIISQDLLIITFVNFGITFFNPLFYPFYTLVKISNNNFYTPKNQRVTIFILIQLYLLALL